ncbi:hypothetical protein RI367_006639 [Sorochytrium milnesiophthora]
MSDAQVPAQTAAAPDNSDAKDKFVTWFKTASRPGWIRFKRFQQSILPNCLSEVFKNDAGDRRPALRRCVDTILLVMLALDLDEHIHGRWKKLLNNEDTWSVYMMRYTKLNLGVLRVRVRAMAEELVLRRYRPTAHLDSDNQEQHSGVVAEGHGLPLLVNLPFHEEAAEVAALAAALVQEQAILFPQPKHQWLEAMGMPSDDQGLHAQECRAVCSVVCQSAGSDPSKHSIELIVNQLTPEELNMLAIQCAGAKLEFEVLAKFCKDSQSDRPAFLKAGHQAMTVNYSDRLKVHQQFLDHLDMVAQQWSGEVPANNTEAKEAGLYAPYVSVIQSSGMGKTRMVYHTAADMHVVYCCVRRPEDNGIPHRSLIADKLLADKVSQADRNGSEGSSPASGTPKSAATPQPSSPVGGMLQLETSQRAAALPTEAAERLAKRSGRDSLSAAESAVATRFERYFAACLEHIVRNELTFEQLFKLTTDDNVNEDHDVKARSGECFGAAIKELMKEIEVNRVRQELRDIRRLIELKQDVQSIRGTITKCLNGLPEDIFPPWPQVKSTLKDVLEQVNCDVIKNNDVVEHGLLKPAKVKVEECLTTMSPAHMIGLWWTKYAEVFQQQPGQRSCRVLFVFDEVGSLATDEKSADMDLLKAMHYALMAFPPYNKEVGTCLAVGMDTQSSTKHVTREFGCASSGRLATGQATFLAPFINVAFMDALKIEHAAGTLLEAAERRRIIRFGRPLFAGTYMSYTEAQYAGAKSGDPESWIFQFAKMKLLKGPSSNFYKVDQAKEVQIYKGARAIALLSIRACITVRDTAELARHLIDSHMAVCYWISPNRDRFSTMHASEPILAEAAAQLLADPPKSEFCRWKDVLDALIAHQQNNDIDLGNNGELVARILLSRAWDRSCCPVAEESLGMGSLARESDAYLYTRPIMVSRFFKALLSDEAYSKFALLWNQPRPEDRMDVDGETTVIKADTMEHDGSLGSDVDDPNDPDYEYVEVEDETEDEEEQASTIHANTASSPLHEHEGKLANAALMFTHFAAIADYTPDVKDLLWAIERGAAFICEPKQTGIDMVIPMVLDHDQRLGPRNIGAILVQVKAAQRTANYPAVATSLMTVERAGMRRGA